jgi:hypothetical protein
MRKLEFEHQTNWKLFGIIQIFLGFDNGVNESKKGLEDWKKKVRDWERLRKMREVIVLRERVGVFFA